MVDQFLLQFGLTTWIGRAQKVKDVGVFENLGSHVRIRRRQRVLKVVDRLALPLVETGFNLDRQHILAKSQLQGFFGIPQSDFRIVQFVQQGQIAAPGN